MFLGRVVRPGVDPQWTAEDRLYVLAWRAEQADRCSGCGHRWADTTDAESFEDFDASTVTCWACAERDRLRRKLADAGTPNDGVYTIVGRRADA